MYPKAKEMPFVPGLAIIFPSQYEKLFKMEDFLHNTANFAHNKISDRGNYGR